MSASRRAPCAAQGPILGVLAAIGLGTAAGFAFFGALAVVIGGAVLAVVLMRRRRRVAACAVGTTPVSVPVELTEMRSRS